MHRWPLVFLFACSVSHPPLSGRGLEDASLDSNAMDAHSDVPEDGDLPMIDAASDVGTDVSIRDSSIADATSIDAGPDAMPDIGPPDTSDPCEGVICETVGCGARMCVEGECVPAGVVPGRCTPGSAECGGTCSSDALCVSFECPSVVDTSGDSVAALPPDWSAAPSEIDSACGAGQVMVGAIFRYDPRPGGGRILTHIGPRCAALRLETGGTESGRLVPTGPITQSRWVPGAPSSGNSQEDCPEGMVVAGHVQRFEDQIYLRCAELTASWDERNSRVVRGPLRDSSGFGPAGADLISECPENQVASGVRLRVTGGGGIWRMVHLCREVFANRPPL